jgi:2-keto-4-pentenoate hydratase
MSAAHPHLQAALCDTLITARREVRRLPLPAHDWSVFSTADALAVQGQQAAHFGWFPDGHPPAWKLGGSPSSGASTAPVPADAVFEAPWQCPPGFAVAFGIEAEIAVRLARDLPAGASAADAWQAIDCFFPCIEFCDTRVDSPEALSAALQLADQQSNRAIILGPALRLSAAPDWARVSVHVEVGGHKVHSSSGGHPFIDPLSSLPWLARHAAEQYDGLRAGDIIATGTWSGIHWAAPGELTRVSFSGFGELLTR